MLALASPFTPCSASTHLQLSDSCVVADDVDEACKRGRGRGGQMSASGRKSGPRARLPSAHRVTCAQARYDGLGRGI